MSARGSDDVFWSYDPDHDKGWQGPFAERFLYYGAGGMLDPKNYTIEPWVLGGGSLTKAPTMAGFARGFLISQAFAFAGVGLVGAIFDPLEQFEGGLDDHGFPSLIDANDWRMDAVSQMSRNWDRMFD